MRHLTLLLCACALTVSCAGCGSSDDTKTVTDRTTVTETTTVTDTKESTQTETDTEANTLTAPPGSGDGEEEPPIVVATPQPDDHVTSPIIVKGTADVFEAVLEAELRTEDGHVLDHARIMASSGSGTRGTWKATLETSATGAAAVVVFSRSPRNGKPINRVVVPIIVD